VIDAIIGELDGTATSTLIDTNSGTSTETVWIRTKNKAKVLPNTTSSVAAPVEPPKRKT